MKVLILNGATKAGGNTDVFARFFESVLKERGHDVKSVGHDVNSAILDCCDCGFCFDKGVCCIKDTYSEILSNFDFDWVVIFSPIYFFGISGKAKMLLDRLYSVDKTGKIISTVTFSGSNTKATSGYDLVWRQISRIALYCDMDVGDSPNFCTEDGQLEIDDFKSTLVNTIEENEALYEEIKEDREEIRPK